MNAIPGFYPPQKGRIVLNDVDITGMPPHKVARLKVALEKTAGETAS